ncbi:MAG: dihydropteroate synthase [Dehalococcoidia bacterium]|nr:dihydropteroate synthase [Dehalococcoidia bacterium]
MPAGAGQSAADPQAPQVAYFEGERELLQVATSAVGLGLDLTGQAVRIVASRQELEALAGALEAAGSRHGTPLRRFLEPITEWRLRTRTLPLDRPIVMGILNLTDDSFSGDGVGQDVAGAMDGAEALRAAGADIIDLGAESARADRPVMDERQEAELVGRVVEQLTTEGHVVSIDTYKGTVARAALEAGAEIVNDISGLTLGVAAAQEAAGAGGGIRAELQLLGAQAPARCSPVYVDVVSETVAWMETQLAELARTGLGRRHIAIDPGIAFGKSHDEDIQVLRRIGELRTFGQPVMLAHSRKNFIGSINGRPPPARDLETHAASALAFAQGVRIFRVHDSEGARRALEMAAAIVSGQAGDFRPSEDSWPWRAGASAAHMTEAAPDKAAPRGQRW